MKEQILAAIGEIGLQPAASLNAGLAANDRVKYAFSLLQMAIDHAEHPKHSVASLKQERIGCGIDDPDLDTVVAEARMVGEACHVPGATRIFARIVDGMRLMAAPVLAAHPGDFATRVDALLGSMPASKDDLIDPAATSAMMHAEHGKTDSLHRLVMDLHKKLNALQVEMAEETLDGAAAYGLANCLSLLARSANL